MKKLLIITFLSISIFGMAQENKQDSIPKLTKEVIYNDVKDVLKSLGESLKVGSEHVYGILVKQQIVASITNIIIYVIFFSISFFLFYNGSKLIDEKDKDKNYNEQRDINIGWLMIPGTIISIISLFFFFFTIRETVTGFVNPEYGAIEKIISLIKH